MNSLSDVAISAGNCYRALDRLIDDFEKMQAEDPNGINLLERFLLLHREFYENIIILTSEDTGKIDKEFEKEVLEEYQKLREIIQSLKKEKGFFEALKTKLTGNTNVMAEYFAHCVDTIIYGYGVDPDSNEIFFVYDEGEVHA